MNRAFGIHPRSGTVTAVIAIALLLGVGAAAAMQVPSPTNSLVNAAPEPNALLAAAPDRLTLTFGEPVAPEHTRVQLLLAGGTEVPLAPAQIDLQVSTRLVVQPRALIDVGDYTVVWSTEAVEDGALLAGAYPFRTGIVTTPGAAQLDTEWPAPWATLLRWLVVLGTALAAGGFAWARPLAPRTGARAPRGSFRLATMAVGALVALLATAVAPVLGVVFSAGGGPLLRPETLRAMPIGWWVQFSALLLLGLLCLGSLVSGRSPARLPESLVWVGVGSGFAALVGFGLAGDAAPPDVPLLALAIAHQWSTMLWLSGVLYLAADWRDLGTDVSHFRAVRWTGGALFAVSVVSGIARAWLLFPTAGNLVASRYGQILLGKGGVVLVVLVVGALAMVVPRRSDAVRASRSLSAQAGFAVLVAFLGTLLALLAAPGATVPVTLAGVALADVVPVDRAAFGGERGLIHLLTQPAVPGAQRVVVRVTDGSGAPLVPVGTPEAEVNWTLLSGSTTTEETPSLRSQAEGTLFTGASTLPASGWWQADVTVTPPGGIASRARFWFVLPDPNVTGGGPEPPADAEARALFARGLASLTSLHSVHYTQRLADGSGSLYRTRTSVTAAEGERPAAYTETVVDAEGNEAARQIVVGDRRWLLADGEWVAAEPIPFLTPAAWGEAYLDAAGFQLGPREQVDGELSQVVTFWQPPRDNPSRAPAWYAWWIGLASGQVRREAMVSTRHYMVSEYSDFNAPIEITPPMTLSPIATPAVEAAPVATPATGDRLAP